MDKIDQLSARKGLSRLFIVMLFDHTSLNITFPILTLIFFDTASTLFNPDVSQAVRSVWYGICVAIPHVMVLIAAPFLSGLSDHYGRKPLLIITVFAALIFSLLSSFAIVFCSLLLFMTARVIQGLFSRSNPIAQAIVGDLGNDERKVVRMALLQLSISIGAFGGPVIGGYFARGPWFGHLNYSMPFLVASVIALIGLFVALCFFKETLDQPLTQKKFSVFSLFSLLKNKKVLSISTVLLLSQISWSMYYQFIPPVLKTHFHVSPEYMGWFVGLIACWLALATAVGVGLLRKFLNVERLLFYSLISVGVGIVLTVFAVSLRWKILLWLAAIPTAAGDVIAYSCMTAMYSDAVSKHEQGKVMGICFVIVSIVWASTAFLGGLLSAVNVILPLIIAPIGMLILLIAYLTRFVFYQKP